MASDRIPTMPQGGSERIPTMPQGGSERIPTMPQGGSERIPTMPQGGSERIPTMPQGGGDRIPTMPQGGSERIPTMPQGADGRIPTAPQQMSAGVSSPGRAPLLTGKLSFTGSRGDEFEIDGGDVISTDSGESQIFGCSMKGSRERFAARILTTVTPSDSIEKRQVRDKVIAFLDSVSHRKDSNILPLIGHGTVKIGEKEHYVEVYPFCKDGDLGRKSGTISYETLCKEVIPAVNSALNEFHKAGFVHRDVKPDNLYYYNGRVVLGDFGITCDLREDGFATDRTKTGTLGYYAPELMSQAAIAPSDYYSFGQTLWTLYSGEMMYHNLLRVYSQYGADEQRDQVNNAMMHNVYYGLDEIPESISFFEVLIRGLLQYDPTERFDYAKVNRWLSGDKGLVKEIRGLEDSKTYSRAFTLLGGECWDNAELAEALNSNWNKAKQLLYDGTLRDFMAMESFELATFIKNIVKEYAYTSDEDKTFYWQDTGLCMLIMHLEKNRRLCWHGMAYERLNDFADLDIFDDTLNANGLMRSGAICEWYQRQKNCSPSVLEALQKLHEFYGEDNVYTAIAMSWLDCFRDLGGEVKYGGCTDLDSLVPRLLESPAVFYGKDPEKGTYDALALVDDTDFLGTMCMWGYYPVIPAFHDCWETKYYERFDKLLEFFDNNTGEETQKKVRAFYNEYGPKGYLKWFCDNLDLYTITGAGCNALAEKAKGSIPQPEDSVQVQRERFIAADTAITQLLHHSEADLFMAGMGMSQTDPFECITSDKLSAMWYFKFLEQEAPIGFKFDAGL